MGVYACIATVEYIRHILLVYQHRHSTVQISFDGFGEGFCPNAFGNVSGVQIIEPGIFVDQAFVFKTVNTSLQPWTNQVAFTIPTCDSVVQSRYCFVNHS